jgi:hypothetical protein
MEVGILLGATGVVGSSPVPARVTDDRRVNGAGALSDDEVVLEAIKPWEDSVTADSVDTGSLFFSES